MPLFEGWPKAIFAVKKWIGISSTPRRTDAGFPSLTILSSAAAMLLPVEPALGPCWGFIL